MPLSFFQRVAESLFGSSGAPLNDEAERTLVDDLTDLVVDAVDARIRNHSRYREKLAGPIRNSIAYLRNAGREGLEPILLTRAAWGDDPRVNAFFATADDVPACLGRSRELRAFFENPANSDVHEAFAILGMKKEERTVLGMDLQGDAVRQDVQQVTVSFTGHRIVAPSAMLAATRLELGRRIIQRLAQVALSRIVAVDLKATELQEHKGYLSTRLRLLNLARDGMEGIVKDQTTIEQQITAIERELKDTVDGYIEAKASLSTLDGYIAHIDQVCSHPEEHVGVAQTPLRMSRLGTKVDASFGGAVNELTLTELAIGENFRGAIAVVRCPRSELPPKEDLVAKAERYL